MPTRSFELTPELDSFIASQVESGAFTDACCVVRAALQLLEREAEDDKWKLFALEKAIDEGEASGIAEGDVFEQILSERHLRRREKVGHG